MRPSDPVASPRMSRAGLALAARRLRLRECLAACGLAVWLLDIRNQLADLGLDFMADGLSYAAAARHLLAGEPLYAPFQLAGPYGLGYAAMGRGFVYPPTAAVLVAPLAALGREPLAVVFVAAWAILALLAFRVARRAGLGPRAGALLALVVAFSGPAINGASSGNVDLAVADALLASWLWPGAAGALAVLGGAMKIFPAAGLVWTVRRRRSLRWPLALGAGVLIATTLIVGMPGWRDFVTAFGNGRSSSGFFIPSPAQLLGPTIGRLLGYGLALAALAGAWRLKDEAIAFSLLGWAMILAAPDWYSHYLVIPLAATLPWVARSLALELASPGQMLTQVPERLAKRGRFRRPDDAVTRPVVKP